MVIVTTTLVSACIALLFAATLNGIYGVGTRRIFSGGFAVGAWAYLALVLGYYDVSSIGRYLATTKLIEYVESLVPEDRLSPYSTYYYPVESAEYYREKIKVVGHCSFAVIVGIFTGLMARRFNASKPGSQLAISNQHQSVSKDVYIPRSIDKPTKR